MPRNPNDLMNLPPSELKSLSDGEYKVYCGIKFESLAKADEKMGRCISKLDRRLWYLMGAMLSTFVAAIASIVAALC